MTDDQRAQFAAEKAQAERDKRIAEDAYRRFIDDTRRLMTGSADAACFRRWVLYVIDSPTFCRSEGLSELDGAGHLITEPLHAYHNGGRRAVGVAIKVLLQRVAPDGYMRMLNEAMGLRKQEPSTPVEVGSQK